MDKIYRMPKDPSGFVSDQELVDAIVQRDPHAMALLFARHSVSIYRFVVRLSGDQSLAEDVVSDVFLDVWRGAHKFRGSSRVSTWLYAIARNKAISARRYQPVFVADDDDAVPIALSAADIEADFDQSSRRTLIRKCLMQLPSVQREVLDLVYYHEKSVAEVAMIVGIPSGTVKTRMFRARGRMVELLKGAGVVDFQMA
jgi:RNA polymerase sigma-70 factor (ECF subfamily)